ncbi:LysR family transcriptional regulator [Sphingomonas bacterium]|uniref:LysR family transcriptional regulator n=1 Tax=Sphingomonas bacterium TaxID=1895847 RepID=UPI0015755CFA|nr:LysR family transcriptional regulator [Sphingomonas bacterium]
MSIGAKGKNRLQRTRPDFAHLEAFLKVAETRSFAEAARQLGVSQPAVSQTIAKLEESYGGDLFERRRGAPVALTLMGRAILPKAKLLLFMVDTQIDRAVMIAQSMAGSLTIGFTSGLASGPLRAGIAEFHGSRPDVELRFVEGSPNELYRQLNERTLDIMFSGLLPSLGGGPNVQERLWDDRLFVALREDHPLAANDSLRWADVSTLPIILPAHHGDLSYYRTIAARMGDLPFECVSHDVSAGAIMDLVNLGLGATIVCTSATVPHAGIGYRPIVDSNALIAAEAIWPKDDRNPLRHRFLVCIRKHASSEWTTRSPS